MLRQCCAEQMLAERSKDYGSKGWSWLKGAYVSAASHVETLAQEQGYKVDLGERLCLPRCPFWVHHSSCESSVACHARLSAFWQSRTFKQGYWEQGLGIWGLFASQIRPC